MLTFIVPLQSPVVSRNWDTVQRLAKRTIQSLCNQDCSDFNVVLVCNKSPVGLLPNQHIHIVERDFPIPEKGKGMADKFLKLRAGLIYIKGNLPDTQFVMVVDADDLISSRLCAYVSHNCDVDSGFLCRRGYLYSDRFDYFTRFEPLHMFCGTSYIIKISRGELPQDISAPYSHPLLDQGHTVIGSHFASLGSPLKELPFRAVAYVTDTSENDSAVSIKSQSTRISLCRLFSRVWISRSVREEFGILRNSIGSTS